MSRLALPSIDPGVLDPDVINTAFAAIATAINDTASGGDSLDGENFPPRSVPPTAITGSAYRTTLVWSTDMSRDLVGGLRQGLNGPSATATFHLGVAPWTGTIVGWTARVEGQGGGPATPTLNLVVGGVDATFTVLADGVVMSEALAVAVSKGDSVDIRVVNAAGAGAHYVLGRAFVHFRHDAIG